MSYEGKLSRGIQGGIAGDPVVVLTVHGIRAEITVVNLGIEIVSCDVACAIGDWQIQLATGLSLPPNTPQLVSASRTPVEVLAEAYFKGLIAADVTYDIIFEAWFNGAPVDTLTLPSEVTFVMPSAEGELSAASVSLI